MSTHYGQFELHGVDGKRVNLLFVELSKQFEQFRHNRAPVLVRASIMHPDQDKSGNVLEIPREHAELEFPLLGRSRLKDQAALPWFYIKVGEAVGKAGLRFADDIIDLHLGAAFAPPKAGSFSELLRKAGVEPPPKAPLADVLSRLFTLEKDVIVGWAEGNPPSQDFPLMDALWRPCGEVIPMREGLVKPVWADRQSEVWKEEVHRCACRRARIPYAASDEERRLAGWEIREFAPEEERDALMVARQMGYPPHTQRIFKLAGCIPVRLSSMELRRLRATAKVAPQRMVAATPKKVKRAEASSTSSSLDVLKAALAKLKG